MKKVMEVNEHGVKLICYRDDSKLNRYRLYRKPRGSSEYEVMATDTLGSMMAFLSGWNEFRK